MHSIPAPIMALPAGKSDRFGANAKHDVLTKRSYRWLLKVVFLVLILLLLYSMVQVSLFRPSLLNFESLGNPTVDSLPPPIDEAKVNIIEGNTGPSVIVTPSANELDYEMFVQEYQWRYKRLPPKGMRAWFNYAKANSCILDDYDMIDTQLDVFRRRGGITKEQLQKAKSTPATFTIYVKDGKFENKDGFFDGWVKPLIEDYVHDLPDMQFTWNYFDEPRVLYPSWMPEGKSIEQFQTRLDENNHSRNDTKLLWDVCEHIPSVKKNGPYHGFFQYPATLDVVVDLVPIFSYGHVPDCFADLIIPSAYAVNEASNEVSITLPTWKDRKAQVLWRGSSTGSHIEPWFNYEQTNRLNHRVRFVTTFATGKKFDIGITRVTQCENAKCNPYLTHQIPRGTSVSHENHYTYKYLWDMDGNGSSGRFIHFLRESKAVILRAKLFSEWLDVWIRPGKHYLMFNFDYEKDASPLAVVQDPKQAVDFMGSTSDLNLQTFTEQSTATSQIISALDWLEANDAKAKTMAEETSKFASAHLRKEDMKCYTYRYLLEYAGLMV